MLIHLLGWTTITVPNSLSYLINILSVYTDLVGDTSAFHYSGSFLIDILSVLIHWFGWRNISVSLHWFFLDQHVVCVDTLIWLEKHQHFITVVLSWSTCCLCWYTDLVGETSAFHNIGSFVIYILSVLIHCLGWTAISVSNSGSYLLCILSVLLQCLVWRSIRVSSQWFLLDLHIVVLIHWFGWRTISVSNSGFYLIYILSVLFDTLTGLENHQSFITVVLTWSTYCRVDTLAGLGNHQSFITVVRTWSTYCLC